MSSLCTITSPSHVAFGPGGADFEYCKLRTFARVAAGLTPSRLSISALEKRPKLNLAFAKLTMKLGGDNDAVAAR